jgi:4-diphosphocytidyl-2-C-methyl-D-erythritol kinase
MLIQHRSTGVVVWAPAKVNLFLEVLHRRPDGYHELATLMVAVSLYDELDIREDASGPDAIRLTCDHSSLSTGPDNLIWRAADLLRRRAGVTRGATIRLTKRIPLAAGLAGGSSDAAATLAGLDRLWGLGWKREQLAALGAELGSDVAFFFHTPAAWCTGRGEVIQPLAPGRPLDIVLACPPVGLSTAEVFRNVVVPSEPQGGEQVRQALETGAIEELGRRLHNRLQPPAERLCPEVARLHEWLAGLGPAGQLMSGSGSTVFALCRDGAEALKIAHGLNAVREGPAGIPGLRVCIVRSCD